MPLTNLNIGAAPNDGTGETLRSGGAKINTNYTFTVTTDTTQTISGAKTFTATVTGGKFVPTANTVAGNGMYLPTTNTVAFSIASVEHSRFTSKTITLMSDTDDFATIFGATANPAATRTAIKLHNVGSGSGGFISFETTATTSTGFAERWRIAANGIFEAPGAQTIRTATGALTLATAAGNGNIIFSPHGTGKVGIGTTAPQAILETVTPSNNMTYRNVKYYEFYYETTGFERTEQLRINVNRGSRHQCVIEMMVALGTSDSSVSTNSASALIDAIVSTRGSGLDVLVKNDRMLQRFQTTDIVLEAVDTTNFAIIIKQPLASRDDGLLSVYLRFLDSVASVPALTYTVEAKP